jgi:hypothetical protein
MAFSSLIYAAIQGPGADMLMSIAPAMLDSCISVSEKAIEVVYEYAGALAEVDDDEAEAHPLHGYEQVLQALASLISGSAGTRLGTCLTAIAALAQVTMCPIVL